MKKVTGIFICVLISLAAFSQKPVKGDKGFTFGLTGIPGISLTTKGNITGSLGFRKMTSDKICLRLGINYGAGYKKTRSDTSGNGIDTTVVAKQNAWLVSIGFQKNLGKMERLVPYYGAEIGYGGANGSRVTNVTVVGSSPAGNIGDFWLTEMANLGKSKVYGGRLLLGFNYFFADHFAFGAEFGYSKLYTKSTNGTVTTKIGSANGATLSTSTPNSASSIDRQLATDGSGNITFSVYF